MKKNSGKPSYICFGILKPRVRSREKSSRTALEVGRMSDFDEAITLIGKMQIEIMQKDAQITRMKALLLRAADQMRTQHGPILDLSKCPHCVLIAEMRKEAE